MKLLAKIIVLLFIISSFSNAQNTHNVSILDTLLIYHIKNNNPDEVKKLIEKGADLNAIDKDSTSAFFLASGSLPLLKYFTEKGIDLHSVNKNGDGVLAHAAYAGNSEVITHMIQNKADINKSNNSGITPLMWAVSQNKLDAVKLLLDNGADPAATDRSDASTLIWAIRHKDTVLTGLLLSHGANINSIADNGNNALIIAASYGSLDIIKQFIRAGADLNVVNNEGYSAAYYAARNNYVDVLKYLVDNGALIENIDPRVMTFAVEENYTEIFDYLVTRIRDLNAKDRGFTALHFAARDAKIKMAIELIKNGADINARTDAGMTPVYLASYNNIVSMLEVLLLFNPDYSITDNEGKTPLQIAKERNHTESVSFLSNPSYNLILPLSHDLEDIALNVLNAGSAGDPSLNLKKSFEAQIDDKILYGPLLDYAIAAKKNKTVKLLLERYISDYNNSELIEALKKSIEYNNNLFLSTLIHKIEFNYTKEFYYNSPLYIAVRHNNIEAVKLILDKASEDKAHNAVYDINALHLSVKYPDILQLMLKYKPDLEQPDPAGNSVLLNAVYRDISESCIHLIDAKADVNASGSNGTTPILAAIKSGNSKTINYLITHGADLTIADYSGLTPLMYAVKYNCNDIVKELVEKHAAGINYTEQTGQTPLFKAAEGENLEALKLLVQKGAILDILDNEGRTPFLHSVYTGSIKSAMLLLELGADPKIKDVYGNNALRISEDRGYMDFAALLSKKAPAFTSSKNPQPKLMVRMGHRAAGFSTGIRSVDYSADGKLMATAADDNTIKIWDISLGQEIYTLKGHKGMVNYAAFSNDAKYIASSGEDQTIILWETSTGNLIRKYELRLPSDKLFFSIDNKSIYFNGEGIRQIEVSSGKIINKTVEVNTGTFTLSKDGKLIAFVSGKQIIIIDSQTFNQISFHESATSEISEVRIAPDNKSLWMRLFYSGLLYKDLAEPGIFKSFRTNTSSSYSYFDFDNNGNIAVVNERDSLEIVNIGTLNVLKIIPLEKYINQINYSSDYNRIIYKIDNSLNLVDLQKIDKVKKIYLGPNSDSVCMYTFSPDGTCIPYGNTKQTIKLWDLRTTSVLSTLSLSGRPSSIVYSPDGKYIAAAGYGSSKILIWESLTGTPVKTITDSTESYSGFILTFSPDGKYFVVNLGGQVSIYETSKWNKIKTVEEIYNNNLNIVSGVNLFNSGIFTPDSKAVILDDYADKSYQLVMVGIPEGNVIRTFKGHRKTIHYVSFSPDGKMLASCSSDGSIKIWHTSTGNEIRTLYGHQGIVYSVCFSPDGKYLASGGEDNIVRIWNAETGELLYNLKGHSAYINTVWFSPDGRYLASGAQDVTVKLWNWKEGSEIATLYALNSIDWAVISPKGLFDASSGAMKLMHYMVGLEAVDLDQLKERYYEPGLLGKLLGYNDEKTREVEKFGSIELFPDVELAEDNISGKLNISLKNRGGGIGKVAVFVNGKEIISDARGEKTDSKADELKLKVDFRNHPFIIPGEKNKIEVRVNNDEGYLSSRGAIIEYTPEDKSAPEVPNLYLISVGVSDYSGDQIDLKYAAKDAEDIAKAFASGAKRLFGNDKTYVYLLTTSQNDKKFLPDKINIIKTFEEIAGKASSKDIIVVYLSGHGINWGGQDGDFYYLTGDAFSANPEAFNDPAIRKGTTIASSELTEMIKKIPALKQVLLIDACASGRTVDNLVTKRDVASSTLRALDRMKDRVGMHIITGCAADAVSYEASRYGQGILTYCLLEGVKGAALREGQFIDINLLFQKTRERVPVVAAGIGGIQEPRVFSPYGAESFDIGVMTEEDKLSVPLAKAKPLFLYATLQEEESMDDLLSLEKLVDEAFRNKASKGNSDAPFIFIEAKDFPDAYRIRGQYTIEESKVKVKINLFQGKEKAGSFALEGEMSNLEELAERIMNKAEEFIK